jgi:hypothetical protein
MHPVAMCEVNFCLVCRNYIVCKCNVVNSNYPNSGIRAVKVLMPVSELEAIIADPVVGDELSRVVNKAREHEVAVSSRFVKTAVEKAMKED